MAELVGCPNCKTDQWIPPGFAGFQCEYCTALVGVRRKEPYYPPNPPHHHHHHPPPPPLVRVSGSKRAVLCGISYKNLPHPPPPLVRVSGSKRAVLCGISYKNLPGRELKGCINDVNGMKHLLTTRFNFSEDSIIILTEEEKDSNRIPTKQNMQRWMRWLVQDCKPGDSLVFHYSGHGDQQQDHTGHEVDGKDETLLPLDYEEEGMIVDNEINETLVRPLPPGARLHAIIDACHSGTVLDLPYVCVFNPREGKCAWEDHRPQNGMRKGTRGGEAISFSGCDDDQTSADTKALSKITSTGAMTFSFIQSIEMGEGKLTYGKLLSSMRDVVREARQKAKKPPSLTNKPRKPSSLTNMLLEGGSYKQGKIQEPQLSSSCPFDVNEKPFYL